MPTEFPLIAINGVIGAQLSPLDRGFAYGDGLFETCRLLGGTLPLWDWHKERLYQGCERLMIPLDRGLLVDYLQQLLAATGLRDGVLKITISRGEGGRGYRLPDKVLPTYCLAVYPFAIDPLNQHGVAVRVCHQRLAVSTTLAGVKHLNRLEQVLARAEWQDNRYAEGLLFSEQGHLIEATASNVFVVSEGRLLTPDLTGCGVAGVMRRIIIEQLASKLGLNAEEVTIGLSDLLAADEVFVCNSVYGIWPVLQLTAGETEISYSTGVVTQRLQQVLAEFIGDRVATAKVAP